MIATKFDSCNKLSCHFKNLFHVNMRNERVVKLLETTKPCFPLPIKRQMTSANQISQGKIWEWTKGRFEEHLKQSQRRRVCNRTHCAVSFALFKDLLIYSQWLSKSQKQGKGGPHCFKESSGGKWCVRQKLTIPCSYLRLAS